MNPANKIKSVMSGKGNNCCLCRSNDGLFTTIGLKQYKNIQDKLLRVLRVKDDLDSKTMCHKCVFKLEIVSQFCSQEVTYNKKCIKCGNEGHEDLKITSPLILSKLRFVGCNLQIDKKQGLLCAACYYKLELLEELKIYITVNTFQASLGNDIGNVITNSERIFPVETLVCCGMVKVTDEARNDEKTYSNITQVNILKVDERKHKTIEVPTKIDPISEKVPIEKPKSLKKENEVKHIVKIKIRGKNDLVKQSSSSEAIVEDITKETPKKRGRPAKGNQLMKKQKIEDPKDDEDGDIILHNNKPIKVPVIILKRTNLKTPQKTSPRKRALKSVNESNGDKDSPKVLKFEHEVVIEVNDVELKEDIPEDSGNVTRDSDDIPKEILKVATDPDSDEDMPLNDFADNSAQREVIFDSLFDTNEKPNDKKIADETSPKKIVPETKEKDKLEIIDSEEKPVTLSNNKEDSDVMTLSDDEEDNTNVSEKKSEICEDDKDESKNDEPGQDNDNEDTSGITDVTEELEETKESTDVEKMETSETHDELALIAEHIKLTERAEIIESTENSVENEEKEQSEETGELAADNMKEKCGNKADETDGTTPNEGLVEDIDKEVIVGDLPEKVLADELPEEIITEELPEKLLAEEDVSEKASKDEQKVSEREPVVEDQILENVSENGFSSTEEDDEIKFKDSEKIAPINSVKTVPSPQFVV